MWAFVYTDSTVQRGCGEGIMEFHTTRGGPEGRKEGPKGEGEG